MFPMRMFCEGVWWVTGENEEKAVVKLMKLEIEEGEICGR